MQQDNYRKWLELQKYQANTIVAQLHRAGRVEECYGDLDQHYERDLLDGVIAELGYSMDDKKSHKPNPSKIPFEGDAYTNLASYRDAIKRYRKFRADKSLLVDVVDDDIKPSVVELTSDQVDIKRSISLERDLQATLRISIEHLEKGLQIIDEGVERSVDSGFIDITARDRNGITVVIELKTGTANQRAIAQILSYMGDVLNEQDGAPVRGIIVAADFNAKAKSAARMVPNLELRQYKVEFTFTDGSE